MSRIVTPGSSSYDGRSSSRGRSFFLVDLVHRFGIRAVLAMIVAALFAFAPLGVLYWFNELRLQSVFTEHPGQHIVVKSGRNQQDQQRDQPGDTALLLVTCEIPSMDGWRELLGDADPSRRDTSPLGSPSVRREQVYLRPSGQSQVPFGLLGHPPVSAWLPAGDYEILVVHEAPAGDRLSNAPPNVLPWISVLAECSLPARQRTVCRVQLPHYDWGNPDTFVAGNQKTADGHDHGKGLSEFLADCEDVTAIPTPAGYVLNLGEPRLIHTDDHRGCHADFEDLQVLPREWTREQIAALRNSLPRDAVPARTRLNELVDHLGWRQFLQGWFCYAAAAVTGLVFTRWGTIALLEPWRRGDAWQESCGLLVRICVVSAALWFGFQVLTNSSGGRGPVAFRLH